MTQNKQLQHIHQIFSEHHSLLLIFIHSFRCLSLDKSITYFKASSPHSAIQCFRFQFPEPSRSLKATQQIRPSSSSSSRHFFASFYLFFNTVFQKTLPTPDMTNPVSLASFYCKQDIPFHLDCMQYRISRPIRRTYFPKKCDLNSTCVLCAEGKYYFQTYKYPYIYYTTSLS